MAQANGIQEPKAPPFKRKNRWLIVILLGVVVLAASCLLTDAGVNTLYHNLGSMVLSRALVASEAQSQDRLLERASTLFQEAVRRNPENGRAYYNLGRIYLARGQQHAALEAFERVVDLAPHDPYANFNLGFLYEQAGQDGDAVRAWREAANASWLVRQGLLCRGQDRDECAERFYKLATDVEPEYADAYFMLALLYTSQGRDTEAIEAYTDALRFPSLQAKKRHLAQARLHSYAERWDDAIAAYKLAIEVDPSNADAYVQLGSILVRQLQDVSGAVEWYLRAVEAEPQNPMPYLRLAHLYQAREDCPNAEKWYRRATAVSGERSEPLARAQYGLALCARQQGNLDLALQAAQKAVHAQPNRVTYHMLLADVLADLRRNEEAIASYLTALALDPDNKRARRRLNALGWQEP
jgi:tetratricopeptide (TPR) repeat protein